MLVFGWRPAAMAPKQEENVTLASRSVFAFEPWDISSADVRKAIQAKSPDPGQRRRRHCRPHCVILELQGRQNEPPVIYEVCQ